MTLTDYLGSLLQVCSAASLLAAAVFAVRACFAPRSPVLEFPPEQPRRTLLWCAAAAIGSRAALALIAWALRSQLGAEYSTGFEATWSQWDGPHYLDIARYGYTSDLSVNGGEQHWFIVFYPLYPALIALLKWLPGAEITAATLISWGCLVGACYVIYRLAEMDHGPDEGRRAVRYLLVFPAAVFLGAAYTESLFLLLSAASLYAMRRGRWALAGATGLLAALTRNLGVLLAVPFLVELLDQLGALRQPNLLRTKDFWRAFARRAPWVVLFPLGLAIYLLVNYIAYGDPLMFLQIQKEHWSQQMQPFWQTVLTTFRCALAGSGQPDNTRAFLWIPQLVGMIALLAALPALTRRLRASIACYLVVYIFVMLSPSWLLSFHRYAMGAVPLLLALAAVTRKRWVDMVLTCLMLLMMFYLFVGYMMGQMVV